jgi:cbb3-type cytochrome oxidase subunit 3
MKIVIGLAVGGGCCALLLIAVGVVAHRYAKRRRDRANKAAGLVAHRKSGTSATNPVIAPGVMVHGRPHVRPLAAGYCSVVAAVLHHGCVVGVGVGAA